MMEDLKAQARVEKYLSLLQFPVKLKRYLGGGTDGHVWETTRETAVKALDRMKGYYNERDTYLRLKDWGHSERIDNFWVPQLVGYNDELMIVEMDMMQHPPYIIDFAKVLLDRPPDFSEQTMEEFEKQGADSFGANWEEVKSLLRTLESYQIYYLDARPGNIMFKSDKSATPS